MSHGSVHSSGATLRSRIGPTSSSRRCARGATSRSGSGARRGIHARVGHKQLRGGGRGAPGRADRSRGRRHDARRRARGAHRRRRRDLATRPGGGGGERGLQPRAPSSPRAQRRPMTLTEGIFPDTANVSPTGHLAVGGSDLVELAGRYGTPLYVYDEATIRARARAFRTALAGYPARTTVCYAAKAYCAPWILRLAAEEGLGLDVVSSGALHTAAIDGYPSERISFHGNNKTEDELEMALRLRVGRVVIDNLEEIGRRADRATAAGVRHAGLLRLPPAVSAR